MNLGAAVTTHGMSYTPEYAIYRAMLKRCNNPSHPSFKRHGARGIRVCDRWLSGFEAFFEDMGPRPSPDHSLEREDNDGNYEKNNCRWATWEEQNSNKRDNHNLTFQGETMTISRWSRRVGIGRATINHRLARGWTVEQALTAPIGTYFNKRGHK